METKSGTWTREMNPRRENRSKMNIFHLLAIDGSWMLHFIHNSHFLSFCYIFVQPTELPSTFCLFFLIISFLPIAFMQICFIHSWFQLFGSIVQTIQMSSSIFSRHCQFAHFFQISYNVCKWLYLLFFILCFLVQSIYLSMIVIIFNLYYLFMATASIRLTEFLSIRFISLRFESFSWKIINERVGHVTSALAAY